MCHWWSEVLQFWQRPWWWRWRWLRPLVLLQRSLLFVVGSQSFLPSFLFFIRPTSCVYPGQGVMNYSLPPALESLGRNFYHHHPQFRIFHNHLVADISVERHSAAGLEIPSTRHFLRPAVPLSSPHAGPRGPPPLSAFLGIGKFHYFVCGPTRPS